MSHYIDTKQTPHAGFGKLSVRQRFEILVGVAVIVVLGVAAFAYVNSADSPDGALGASAATAPLTMVTHSALDPFETQFVSPSGAGTESESDRGEIPNPIPEFR